MERIRIGRVIATAGAVLTGLGTFLPWLRSGTRRRNSYEIFSLVDRLGFSPSSLVGWGLRLWPMVPFLLALTVTLQWFRKKWVTSVVAIVTAVYTGGVAAAVRLAPSNSLIAVEYGPLVALIGALIVAAGTLLAIPLPNRP